MTNNDEDAFLLLEQRISDLLVLIDNLATENQAMRSRQSKWVAERAELVKKNNLAKTKLESVLGRLKGMLHS